MLIKINIAYSLQNSLILVNQLYEVLFHFFHFLRCFEMLVVLQSSILTKKQIAL